MTTLEINRKQYKVDVAADTPLLWALRDQLKLHGTKYGCGIEQCAAPAPSTSTDAPYAPVASLWAKSRAKQSPPSKDSLRTVLIRSSKPGLRWTCPSVATARQV